MITKKKSPWFTENIKFMIKLKKKALFRFRNTKLQTYWNYYKNLRNLVTRKKKAYMQHRLNDKINKSNIFRELKNRGIGFK